MHENIWCIRPELFESVLSTLQDKSLNSYPQRENERPYQVESGAALIKIYGPLTKRASIFSLLLGGNSMTGLGQMIDAAAADAKVSAIVLDVDSPGGMVSGTDALAEAISRAGSKKPVVAYANGCMCSAAYWVASAAHKIVAERTAAVGSIGVLYVHGDFSKADERYGVKYTIIKSGRYKAVGNAYQAMSDEDQSIIQAELDAVYDIFIQAVAASRSVSAETVHSYMADGRVFIGQAAASAGLVDQVGTMADAVRLALSMAGNIPLGALATSSQKSHIGEKKQMAQEQSFMQKVEEYRGANKCSLEAALLATIKAYPHLHRNYIEQANEGHEVQKPARVVHRSSGQGGNRTSSQAVGFESQVKAYQAKHACSLAAAQLAVRKSDPKAFQDYINAVNN